MFPSPEATIRTADPVHPARDLNWYNHVLCADCYCVLETCYRIDKQDKTSEYNGLTNKGIIDVIEENPEDRADFLKRKKCRTSCLQVAAEDGQFSATQDVGTAVHLVETEGTDESLEEFDFYKWGDYQKDKKLGNQSNSVLDGHSEITYKGEKGVAIWAKPKHCVRVRIYRRTGCEVDNVLATTINENEICENEISRVVIILNVLCSCVMLPARPSNTLFVVFLKACDNLCRHPSLPILTHTAFIIPGNSPGHSCRNFWDASHVETYAGSPKRQ